ncbi:MAG TPA: hypothetical protein VFB34_05325 [Chloroflexota bacterium]|nr:hypothetical protein [Chloroflexota bacterium]
MGRRGIETLPRQLLEEARAIEVLLSDLEPAPEEMERYWDLSARMITLMIEIETFAATSRATSPDNPDYLRLRRSLRGIEGEATELMRTS